MVVEGKCTNLLVRLSAEALASGQITVIPRLRDIQDAREVDDDRTIEEEYDMSSTRDFLNNLPFVQLCSVCNEDGKQGFTLACGHCMCICCTRQLFQHAIRDSSLLPLRCCEVPIDMTISRHILTEADNETFKLRVSEREASNKMYCPTCNKFINLDFVDALESTELICICETVLCISCKSISHPRFTCAENRAIVDGDDTLLLEAAKEHGWKQCPDCRAMIELEHGCNHITCSNCSHEFCFQCLSPWDGRTCSSGRCEVWEENRLLAAGEARVDVEEHALQIQLPAAAREQRVRRAMVALQENEGCDHQWVRRNGYLGNCERCNYDLYCYGMRCVSDCESTVCYTCANFRIPRRGWR